MIKRILLVEDSPVTREVTLRMLHGLNVNCYSVLTGEEAVDLADFFDLILMDINLPGINGWEACRRIRRREKLRQHAQVPIIALTSVADKFESGRAGMTDHFRKPILSTDLEQIVKRWLIDPDQQSAVKQLSALKKVYG